jgi:hypothetical protein
MPIAARHIPYPISGSTQAPIGAKAPFAANSVAAQMHKHSALQAYMRIAHVSRELTNFSPKTHAGLLAGDMSIPITGLSAAPLETLQNGSIDSGLPANQSIDGEPPRGSQAP